MIRRKREREREKERERGGNYFAILPRFHSAILHTKDRLL